MVGAETAGCEHAAHPRKPFPEPKGLLTMINGVSNLPPDSCDAVRFTTHNFHWICYICASLVGDTAVATVVVEDTILLST